MCGRSGKRSAWALTVAAATGSSRWRSGSASTSAGRGGVSRGRGTPPAHWLPVTLRLPLPGLAARGDRDRQDDKPNRTRPPDVPFLAPPCRSDLPPALPVPCRLAAPRPVRYSPRLLDVPSHFSPSPHRHAVPRQASSDEPSRPASNPAAPRRTDRSSRAWAAPSRATSDAPGRAAPGLSRSDSPARTLSPSGSDVPPPADPDKPVPAKPVPAKPAPTGRAAPHRPATPHPATPGLARSDVPRPLSAGLARPRRPAKRRNPHTGRDTTR